MDIETSIKELKNKHPKYLQDLEWILKYLEDNKILNAATIDLLLCFNADYTKQTIVFSEILWLRKLLEVFAKNNFPLTFEYFQLNFKFVIGQFDKQIDLSDYYEILLYFSKQGLFTLKTFNDLLARLQNGEYDQLLSLLSTLAQTNLMLTEEYYTRLLSLKERKLKYIDNKLDRLEEEGLLEDKSFFQLLAYMNDKSPYPAESKVTVDCERIAGQKYTTFLIDQKLKLAADEVNGQYEDGGRSKVLKASVLNEKNEIDETCYALKKLAPLATESEREEYKNKSSIARKVMYEGFKKRDLENLIATAKYEIKYHHLMGNNGHFFQHNNSAYLAFDWFEKKDLYSFCEAYEIKKIPVADRIAWLSSGIDELNKLHSRFRVHNDIKPENFIVDPKNKLMHLIDFGSAHKRTSEGRKYFFTPEYSEELRFGYQFYSDIFSFGFVIAKLFPELYNIVGMKKFTIEQYCEPTKAWEFAIVDLVNAVMNTYESYRPTALEMSHYCAYLRDNFATLTKDKVKQIASTTIAHQKTNVNDVIHDARRPTVR